MNGVYKDYIARRTNDLDIKFTGVLLGHVYSPVYNNRWMELLLYQTKSGSYVCQRIEKSEHKNEQTRYKTHVLDDIGDVYDFFGFGYLSKQLYMDAGIPCVEEID